VGECPTCDSKYDKAYLAGFSERPKTQVADEDFSDMEEFKESFVKKGWEPFKKEPVGKEPMPIDILKNRLAKGEIDIETYNALKKELE
jgi:hypothetical protein